MSTTDFNSLVKKYKKKQFANIIDTDDAPVVSVTGETKGGQDFRELVAKYQPISAPAKTEVEDIAPVRDGGKSEKAEDGKLDFFQKGAFDDGYNFGDVTKTILGTAGDAGLNVVKGIAGLGEGLGDLITYGIAGVADLVGKDEYAEDTRKRASLNLVDKYTKGADDYLNQYSILGRTSDSILQGVGQVGGIIATGGIGSAAGLGAAGTTALTSGMMGLSSMGSGMGEAYQNNATDLEALKHGLNAGAVDAVTELIFGGLGKAVNAVGFSKGLTSADDILAKLVGSKFKHQVAKNIVEFGIKSGAEGLEEVIAGFAQAYSKYNTYMSDEDFVDILKDENLLEQFIVGAASSGIVQSPGLHIANTSKTDFITGQTQNEQAVIKKEVENRIAEAEKDGKKLSVAEKSKIEAQVEKDMERGYISTDTIEEVLGGESYTAYKDNSDKLDALQAEYDELYNMKTGDKSDAQIEHQAKLKQQLEELKQTFDRTQARTKLNDEVFEMVKGDRLAESYNELARRHQAYTADLSKYDEKQKAVIQKAIDSGVLNNSNRTHEFVDLVARISADKGVLFDFTNNKKLRESGFAMDGVVRNGFVSKDGVTLNVQAAKSLNKVVGHEITHVLEGTELYNTLQETVIEYAKSKGEYDSRLQAITELYNKHDPDADPVKELTADLVGDYLFTDTEFINNLSTNHRNVFQKMYDEVKYLCKVATAGSKEARQLEKVKKAFEDAYRADSKAQTETQNSLSDSTGNELTKEQQEYFKDSKMRDDNGNLMVMYHGSQDAGFHVFDSSMSDDDTSFFFVDRNDVAASYSGTTETYEARTIRTAEYMNNFIAEIDAEGYEVVEENGKFILLYEGDRVADSNTAKGIYDEFCWYEGVGEGDANYKVYLNLKNPLVVDADGRNWDNVSREFSQEIADKYKSLTAEEKEALTDLAEWGEISVFRDELRNATEGALASAYEKLGKDINMYDLFSIAEDNFSDLAIEAWAVKQMNTRDYAQRAKEQGYDGVIFKNIVDIGGYGGEYTPSTVAVAFDSNQIKSVANDKPTADPDIRFSLSEDTSMSDNAIAKNADLGFVPSDVMDSAKALREYVANRLRGMKENGVAIPDDIKGSTAISNSSYDITEENTTICPRSLASEAFTDAVSEYLGRPLTYEEQIYISQDLQSRSLTPECVYCYVATDRKAYRAFLGEYVKQRDSVIQKLAEDPNANTSRSSELYKEFLNGRKDTEPMYKRFKMWVDSYKNGTPMIDASHLANINKLMGDINSEFGAELKPQIVDAMKYAQSASWAKKRVSYVAYDGHILKWKQNRIDKLNSHYGLRMYSFSDFHPAFVLENMQMITDASVRGLKMLGYTKDIDFVDIFAPTGMNINVSTFGFESGGNVYENNIIGAEWEKAKALREQYPNVGVTFVATNDTLVNWALEQDWIDVVIPFHLVRTGAEVAKAFNFHDYTGESSDVKDVGWDKGTDKKYIAPTEHNNDKATYLAALAKNHLKPRFERFIDNPNYMKLVNECRQPASESQPVQPKFGEEAIDRTLAKLQANGYYQPIGGSVDRMYEIAAEVAENMIAPTQHSLSNLGEADTPTGNYKVYGKDIALPSALTEDIAPIAEESSVAVSEMESVAEDAPVVISKKETTTEELFPDNLSPIDQEIDNLAQQFVDLESRLFEMTESGQFGEEFNRLSEEWSAVKARLEALEQEANAADADRLASLEDMDAPPEMEMPYQDERTDSVHLPKDAVQWIASSVEDMLPIQTNKQTTELHNIIQEYSTSEYKSRDALYERIRDSFGSYSETKVDEDIREAKKMLKVSRINIDDAVKNAPGATNNGIRTNGALRRAYWGKVLFAKNGLDVDEAYQQLTGISSYWFPESISNPEDQLRRILEIADKDIKVTKTHRVKEQTLWDVTDSIIDGVGDYSYIQKEQATDTTEKGYIDSLMGDIAPSTVTEKNTATQPVEPVATEEVHNKKGVVDGQQAFVLNDQELSERDVKVNKALQRIDRKLSFDKSEIDREYRKKKLELQDKDGYISRKATELYNEIRNLKKGVKASEQLGYLLDYGYEWQSVKAALVNIRHTPDRIVNVNSEIENIAREMLNKDYEDNLYNLDEAYRSNVEKLEADAEVKRNQARTAAQRSTVSDKKTSFWKNLIGDTSTWKDMPLGLMYKTKTLKRILRHVVRDANGKPNIKLADEIYRAIESKYDHNEALLKRESNRLKDPFAKLGLNHTEYVYAHMLGEFRHNPDSELTEDVVNDYLNKHKNKIDSAKVDSAIDEARKLFDDLFERVNTALRAQGFKEIPYRKGYFPHFTNPKQNWFQKLMNWKPVDNEIPTSIAGLTQQFKPQRSWQAFDKQRKSDITEYGLDQALDTYIHGALDWIYHIDDLQDRRSLENYLRYIHSDEGIKARIDEIKADESLDAEDAQKMIDGIYSEARNPLGNLVRELMNRTNTLANKKSSMDREMEDDLNRKVYSTMTNINKRINGNMVVGSLRSALTNFIPIVQSWHMVSPWYTVNGLGDFVKSTIRDDGMIAKSDFLTNRLIEEEKLYQTGWDKTEEAVAFVGNVVDSITSQTVWRSKYLQNLHDGMSEVEAIRDADQYAKDLIAGRSRGNQPTVFDAKNPVTKLLTSFQLEVANQYGHMFEDVPIDSKNNARLVKGYATALVGAYVYNALFSTFTGSDAALDPIGIIEDFLRDLGMFGDDDEEEDKTQAFLNLGKNIVQEVPFVGGYFGGGRVPISSALPYGNDSSPMQSLLADVEKGWNDGNWTEGNWTGLVKEMLKPLYYVAMPVGGGQLKKGVEGLGMFLGEHPIAGSYTDSGDLRFPVDVTAGNVIQAGLFGQYASKNAREYFDQGRKPLNEKQIQEFMDVGMTIQDYWNYRDGLSGLKTLAEKADYIDSLNLTDEQKNVLINNIADRKEDIDMSTYDEYSDFEEFDFAIKNPEKYDFFQKNGISYGDYASADEDLKRTYTWAYDNPEKYQFIKDNGVTLKDYSSFNDDQKDAYTWAYKNPEKFTLSKAVTNDLFEYRAYTSELYDIRADKDANGKSISGSAKEKKWNYISSLNIDKGAKYILFKSEYNADDTYNYEIIDYLNSRDDISYTEMHIILSELGFEVDARGNISW